MANRYIIHGKNNAAPFTLKVYRGDGMALLAMNWKYGKEPPADFVGFAIEYKEPDGMEFYALKNRLNFPDAREKDRKSTLRSPIQKFRWVHFPRNADLPGDFTYRVTPVFMNDKDELRYGDAQIVKIQLRRETYPNQLNIAFTRGFVSSQAFVEKFLKNNPISQLLPSKASAGLTFTATHPDAQNAYGWMGFEAREVILDVLDQAIKDNTVQVRVIAYDLNEPNVVDRLVKLGSRLQIIIDDSKDHIVSGAAEITVENRLRISTQGNVKRQHMGNLQHNKTIVIDGPNLSIALCGSTNFSWRGFFVQSNNVLVLYGKNAVQPFISAFDNYWNHSNVAPFNKTPSNNWTQIGLNGINAEVVFSPHLSSNSVMKSIADDIRNNTKTSLFYSLAFLYQSKGAIWSAINDVTNNQAKHKDIFVYGISDKKVGSIKIQKPNGNFAPLYPASLAKGVPEPFKSEPKGGSGIRMHHKFIVIDFNKPSARVYVGSHNLSGSADLKNGDNLLLIRDPPIAVSYAIEAIRLFDHYHFRVNENENKRNKKKKITLAKPPSPGNKPWWDEYYSDPLKKRDRVLFA